MQDSPGAEHDEGQPQEGQDAPPGSPFVPVKFTGLTATPYVNQAGRPAFALRLDESDQVDMVPRDGARDRGALPDQISPIPGPAPEWGTCGWKPHLTPVRVRAAYVTDADILAMASAVGSQRLGHRLDREDRCIPRIDEASAARLERLTRWLIGFTVALVLLTLAVVALSAVIAANAG